MLVPDALQHLCVFGLTLNAALSWPEARGQRTVDVVELWCGVGSIAAAAAAAGYVVCKFDKFRVPGVSDVAGALSEDLLSSCGFKSAVRCVLSMREGALLWMGPVCSSFVFMNSSRCKRTLDNPLGDVDYKPVAERNLHASVAAFLYALACLRSFLPIVENPVGSLIFRFPALQLVTAFFSAGGAVCCRCAFASERVGKRCKKAYKLVGPARSGVSVRLASARVVYTVHWSTESCDMARSTHVGGRSYYANLLLTHPGWGNLYSACGRSMDVHLRHQAAQLRTWDVSILWTIRRPRNDRSVHLPPRRHGRHQCMRTPPPLHPHRPGRRRHSGVCPLSTRLLQTSMWLLQLGSLCRSVTRLSGACPRSRGLHSRCRWQHPDGKGLTLNFMRGGLARDTVHCRQGRAALHGRCQTSEFK